MTDTYKRQRARKRYKIAETMGGLATFGKIDTRSRRSTATVGSSSQFYSQADTVALILKNARERLAQALVPVKHIVPTTPGEALTPFELKRFKVTKWLKKNRWCVGWQWLLSRPGSESHYDSVLGVMAKTEEKRRAKMPKYAIYNGTDWIRDVHADSEAEAIKQDDTATRAELISLSDEGRP